MVYAFTAVATQQKLLATLNNHKPDEPLIEHV